MVRKTRGQDPEQAVVDDVLAHEERAKRAARMGRTVLAVEYPAGTRHPGNRLEAILAGLHEALWPTVIVEVEAPSEPGGVQRIRPSDGTAKIYYY